MTTQETQIPHGVLGDIQANSGTAIWSGALLIFMGLLAIAAPAIAGEAITILVGVALIARWVRAVLYGAPCWFIH